MSEAIDPAIVAAHERLVAHPLYGELTTRERVQVFMEHHVFAVWDFFSLLKRLQREVTCVETPWLPRPHGSHARFVMEIVLAEEADEDGAGGYVSHFDLYRRAMAEVGADAGPIDGYTEAVARGEDPLALLQRRELPACVQEFVGHTLSLALNGAPHEVAASFCHGRENLLPDVLSEVQGGLGDDVEDVPTFRHYLARHIELDHDEHGPLALKLLDALCDGDPARRAAADRAGVAAIEARIGLWDGILAAIRERERASVAR